MEAIFWYAGAAGAALCIGLNVVKFILVALGSDTNPRLAKLADALPPTKFILLGQLFFLAMMMVPLFFH